jgi:hypothetical protein
MARLTKKQMMNEMIFIYEAFPTAKQVAEQTREKLHKYSSERRYEQVERCYNYVMSARNAKGASEGIFCCTGIALKF